MTFDISDLGGVCGRDQAWRSSDSRGLSRAIDLVVRHRGRASMVRVGVWA